MSDNVYPDCPARMSDGRFLGDRRTSDTRELYNMRINGITRAQDYKKFLQKNAKTIMNGEWNQLRKTQTCFKNQCHHSYPLRSTPSQMHNEMKGYALVHGDHNKKGCGSYPDYRMTETN